MHAKTMEGLAGAGLNMKMVNIPMGIYRDAARREDAKKAEDDSGVIHTVHMDRRKLSGDEETMDRSMGYVNTFTSKAIDYKKKAIEGIQEEAAKAREEKQEELEKTIEKRREDRKAVGDGQNADSTTSATSTDKKSTMGTSKSTVDPRQVVKQSEKAKFPDAMKKGTIFYTDNGSRNATTLRTSFTTTM